jgi:hypothetical protein
MPDRIQRSRVKGWRKPDGTVDVTRAGKWGNPFAIMHDTSGWWIMTDAENGLWHTTERHAAETSVKMFLEQAEKIENTRDIQRHLAGRNLMCFCTLCPVHTAGKPFGTVCKLCMPCHADVLGEIANGARLAVT